MTSNQVMSENYRSWSVRHNREVVALALDAGDEAEVVHGQALGGAPVQAEAAADAGALVDDHRRRVLAEWSKSLVDDVR